MLRIESRFQSLRPQEGTKWRGECQVYDGGSLETDCSFACQAGDDSSSTTCEALKESLHSIGLPIKNIRVVINPMKTDSLWHARN